MRNGFGAHLAGRLAFLAVLAVVAGYAAVNLRGGREQDLRQAERAASAVRTALAQCYALEGGYPENVDYLANYGVIFENDRFYYYYERGGVGNYMPEVRVAVK